jgi:hypothetical protein
MIALHNDLRLIKLAMKNPLATLVATITTTTIMELKDEGRQPMTNH